MIDEEEKRRNERRIQGERNQLEKKQDFIEMDYEIHSVGGRGWMEGVCEI